jgi:Tfp pilus assembly protein PilN
MINLLPPQHAAAIRYARQNTVLRRWLLGAFAAIVGLVLILVSGWIYIGQVSKGFQRNIDVTNQQLRAQNLDKVQSDAKEITGDINVINKVLNQEVHFSDLIQAIGNDMPAGTVLSSLSLSNKVSGALDLSTSAKDYTSATQIAVNLSDPKNQLFSKVDIINVSCSSSSNQAYKCSATLRALFAGSARSRFIGTPSGGSL